MVRSIQGTLGLTLGWSDTTLDGRVFLQWLQFSRLSECVLRAVVGPLMKKQYLEAVNGFQVWKAFPDYDTGAFGFKLIQVIQCACGFSRGPLAS